MTPSDTVPVKPDDKLQYIRYMSVATDRKPMYLITRRSSRQPDEIRARLYSDMASAAQAMKLWMLKDADAMHIDVSANDLPDRKVIVLMDDIRSYTYQITPIYPDTNIEEEI